MHLYAKHSFRPQCTSVLAHLQPATISEYIVLNCSQCQSAAFRLRFYRDSNKFTSCTWLGCTALSLLYIYIIIPVAAYRVPFVWPRACSTLASFSKPFCLFFTNFFHLVFFNAHPTLPNIFGWNSEWWKKMEHFFRALSQMATCFFEKYFFHTLRAKLYCVFMEQLLTLYLHLVLFLKFFEK